MSSSSERLSAVLVIAFVVTAYYYPEGILVWYFIVPVFGLYVALAYIRQRNKDKHIEKPDEPN